MIELMIVIAVIGLLSVVLIPKVLPLKDAAKNNAVEANVLIVRSFLENRAGADKINIVSSLKADSSISNALNSIKDDIGIKMNTTFSGSSAMKNPFNNATKIDKSSANVALNSNLGSSSVIIGYDVMSIPTVASSITNTVANPGVTVIIVYETGYVTYGVDNFGEMVKPTLINMPEAGATLPDLDNPLTPQVVAPTFNYTFGRDGGSYTLSCEKVGATIRYTTDDTKPDLTSAIYVVDVPISVTGTTTIKAYATYEELSDSNIASTTFTPLITIPILTPSFSFSGDFGTDNIIAKGVDVAFSIDVTPIVLSGTMEVTIDDGIIKTIDAINGIYTFTAPTDINKICTIRATLTIDNSTIDNEEFIGKLVLTTDNN